MGVRIGFLSQQKFSFLWKLSLCFVLIVCETVAIVVGHFGVFVVVVRVLVTLCYVSLQDRVLPQRGQWMLPVRSCRIQLKTVLSLGGTLAIQRSNRKGM